MLTLPKPPAPVGAYSAVVIRGELGFVSGQFPLQDGVMAYPGQVGVDLDMEQAQAAARIAAINVLAQIDNALGSWESFGGLCRVDGIIATRRDFTSHATVLDGASELFVRALGRELGSHARSASAAPALPGKAAVELVVTFLAGRTHGAADS